MTIVITRLFSDADAAQSAADRLQLKGIPKRDCDIIVDNDNAAAQMDRALVQDGAAAAYGKKLASGAAVLVVRTTYRPLGAAKLTRDILSKRDTLKIKGGKEEHYVRVPPSKPLSILKDHPHMLTLPGFETHGRLSDIVGMPLIKAHKSKRSTMSADRRMSRMFWPMPLVSRSKHKSSAMSGGGHMSRAFWPMPLLSTKPRRKSVTPSGAFQFSRILGMRTTS